MLKNHWPVWNKESFLDASSTVIGPSTTLCGSLYGAGDLIIQGRVEGVIKIKGRLDISGEAQVKASIDVEKSMP